jgi:hypothetical protein
MEHEASLPPLSNEPWIIGMEVLHKGLGIGTVVSTFSKNGNTYGSIQFESLEKEFRLMLFDGWGGFFRNETGEMERRKTAYLHEHGDKYLENARRRHEEAVKEREESEKFHEEQRFADFQKKHNAYREAKGLPLRDVRRKKDIGKIRSAHCWSCRMRLSNLTDYECTACGWILCKCGSCGCGRPFRSRDESDSNGYA